MKIFPILSVMVMTLAALQTGGQPVVRFEEFSYQGNDSVFNMPLNPGQYRNPVIAGFAPDPSVVRVGEWTYLVNSSFCWWPGVPVYRSKDLVSWESLGHVLTRPEDFPMEGLRVSRGIFAPAIEYHDGLFYMVTTAVDCGGNFYVTAKDPAGPWSEPVWLREVDGIDPSFFFDDDGRAWLLNNGPPPHNEPLYEGHRAIWIQQFDPQSGKLTGPREIIVNGGANLDKKPVWVEGPHLYKRNSWYYLSCAEGGTSENHSQVIFRSKSPTGPFTPWEKNPILTQRDLPREREHPVTSVGHADLVELSDGSWWAVFLGCRPYQDGVHYNTGRETFLLPVDWKEDWPVILPGGEAVPFVAEGPDMLPDEKALSQAPLTGNFTWKDTFDGPSLDSSWSWLRGGSGDWFRLVPESGSLELQAGRDNLDTRAYPSFLARRIQHARFTAVASLGLPEEQGVSAGLAAFQNESHYYYLGLRRSGDSVDVFIESHNEDGPIVLCQATLPGGKELYQLRLAAEDSVFRFSCRTEGGSWIPLPLELDATRLSTRSAGGFVGAHLGLFARVD